MEGRTCRNKHVQSARIPALSRDSNKAFPFCSDRCKSIDLSRWLDQSYLISTPAPHLKSHDPVIDDFGGLWDKRIKVIVFSFSLSGVPPSERL